MGLPLSSGMEERGYFYFRKYTAGIFLVNIRLRRKK
jgi:hypothetical protein